MFYVLRTITDISCKRAVKSLHACVAQSLVCSARYIVGCHKLEQKLHTESYPKNNQATCEKQSTYDIHMTEIDRVKKQLQDELQRIDALQSKVSISCIFSYSTGSETADACAGASRSCCIR